MVLRRYIAIFLILISSANASTKRDLIEMRTAVFGAIFTLFYYTLNSERVDNLDNKYSLLYLKGKEFTADTFLHDDRVTLSRENSYIVDSKNFKLTSSFELSAMRWNSQLKDITNSNNLNLSGYIYSITPMFKYYFKKLEVNNFKPFIELGVGVSFMDSTLVEKREKSTQFQFNDNIGAGFTYGKYIVGYRFIHYSNLGIKKPNPSIDLHHIYFGFKF